MDKTFKIITTALGGVFGYLWGEWSPVLQVLLSFVVIDYITGLLASGLEGKLSSKVGFKGIAKKVMIFCLVAVGHLVDTAIGEGHMFRDAITFFYIGNELLSIIENAGRTGIPVPDKLKSAVEILKGRVNKV